MDNKELIWVDKDFVSLYKELESDVKKADLVNKPIDQKKIEVTSHIMGLDDDLLRFKAFALNYSTEFKKAYNIQVEKLEQIYEECSDPINKISRVTARVKNDIEQIGDTMNKVSWKLQNLNINRLERVLELINTYSNMSENDKEVFKVILGSKQ